MTMERDGTAPIDADVGGPRERSICHGGAQAFGLRRANSTM
jgi:hypothetical protein